MNFKFQHCRAPSALILPTLLILILSTCTDANKIRQTRNPTRRPTRTSKGQRSPAPSREIIYPTNYPTIAGKSPTLPPTLSPSQTPHPTYNPISSPTTHSPTSNPTLSSTLNPKSSEAPTIPVKLEKRQLPKVQIIVLSPDDKIVSNINMTTMKQITSDYFTESIKTYNNGSFAPSFKGVFFEFEEEQQPGGNSDRRRMSRSKIRGNVYRRFSSSIDMNRQRQRQEQELVSKVISMWGETLFRKAGAPTVEEVNLMHKNFFIDSPGKANYMNALETGEVVTGSFQMEINSLKQDLDNKPSNDNEKSKMFYAMVVGAGALLLFLIAGFGYCTWKRRSHQFYQKSGTKSVMLSDDDWKLPSGTTVSNQNTDGTTIDVTALTPSTLVTSKSFLSTGGDSYDYSLDGSYAIGSSPNKGDQFLEGVMKMSEYPVQPTIDEGSQISCIDHYDSASVFTFSNEYADSASLGESAIEVISVADKTKYSSNRTVTHLIHSNKSKAPPSSDNVIDASSVDNHDSASAFSFSNQFIDSASLAGSAIGGMSVASSQLFLDKTKHSTNKPLTRRINNKKYDDGIEVLIGDTVSEADVSTNTDLFDDLYAPRSTAEERPTETKLSAKDTVKISTPIQETIWERTSIPLEEDDCNKNVEKKSTETKTVGAEKSSTQIDPLSNMCAPSPKDENQYDQNFTNIKYKAGNENEDMPSSKQTKNKLKNSNEQQIDAPPIKSLPAGEVTKCKEKCEIQDMPSKEQNNINSKNITEEQINTSVVLPTGESEILVDFQGDKMSKNEINTQSSPYKISVATMPSTQLSDYPVQSRTHITYSYGDSTDDESASYEGSSSDDNSSVASKPLQNATINNNLTMSMNHDQQPLSPASKRKLLSGKTISRDRMNARIRPTSPSCDNFRIASVQPFKDGVSSTNHAANVRRHRLTTTLHTRSANKNMSIQDQEELISPSNIGKELRKKRLQQQKIVDNFRTDKVQKKNRGRKFAC